MNILVGIENIDSMASMEIIRVSAPALAPALLKAKPLRSCASAPAPSLALLKAKPLRSCASDRVRVRLIKRKNSSNLLYILCVHFIRLTYSGPSL